MSNAERSHLSMLAPWSHEYDYSQVGNAGVFTIPIATSVLSLSSDSADSPLDSKPLLPFFLPRWTQH